MLSAHPWHTPFCVAAICKNHQDPKDPAVILCSDHRVDYGATF
jgi:hypothetical protein